MKDGNYSARLNDRLDDFIEMRKIYTNLRGKNLDLFTVSGRLIALPDAEREPHKYSRDYLVMNEKDWERYSKILKKTTVAETLAKRDYSDRNKSEEDLIREGMDLAKMLLESNAESGRPVKKFTHDICCTFGLQALKEAVAGGLPLIES